MKLLSFRKKLRQKSEDSSQYLKKYEEIYFEDTGSAELNDHLAQERMKLIDKYQVKNGVSLDLCCGNGSYLEYLSRKSKIVYGADAIERYLDQARLKTINNAKVELCQIDARHLSKVYSNEIDFLTCFCSLYVIPNVNVVVTEISRALKPNGIAILEFGNWSSLAYFIGFVNSKSGINHRPYGISYKKVQDLINSNSMEVLENKFFQLVPYFGAPRSLFFLRPITGQYLRKLMSIYILGKTLDERLSSLIILRRISFRMIVVVRKIASQ
jgi:ubiquinone/menaquinone biosynthesis C-methylase UbiE